ncbi:tetratricopeptide repeat protein [bacterium]|nr:tetratricopeptide repeat protein [bacterium]
MDGLERLEAYIKSHPELLKRVLVAAAILGIGVPIVLWQIRSSEEKAYILFTNGYYYYKNQSVGQSHNALSQLVQLYPGSKFIPMARYYLALNHLLAGQYEDAISQFKIFMDENPKHFVRERVYPMWMAAEIEVQRPHVCVDLAEQFFSEYSGGSPAAAEVLYRKGVGLTALGRQEEAAACFKQSSEMGRDGNIFANLAFYAHTARPSM